MSRKYLLLASLAIVTGAEAGALQNTLEEANSPAPPTDPLAKMLSSTDNQITNMIDAVKNTSYDDVVASIAKMQDMVADGIANLDVTEAMKKVDMNLNSALELMNARNVAASVEEFVRNMEDTVGPMMVPIQAMVDVEKISEAFKNTFDMSTKMAALKDVKFDSAAVQAITDLKEYTDLSAAFDKLKETMSTFMEPANEFLVKMKPSQDVKAA